MLRAKVLVLVANSVHARVLRRTPGSDGLHTWLTVENGPALAEGRTAPGADRRRAERIHNFAAVLAAHLRELLRQHPDHGLVLAAPPRVLGPLQAELAATGAVRASVAKDLVRLDDHEVAERLAAELRHVDGRFAAA